MRIIQRAAKGVAETKRCAMNFEDFKDPEVQEKLKEAQSPQELLELAREAGFELTDEQLEDVSGGKYDWGCWEKSSA